MILESSGRVFLAYVNTNDRTLVIRLRPAGSAWDLSDTGYVPVGDAHGPVRLAEDRAHGGVHYLVGTSYYFHHGNFTTDGVIPEGPLGLRNFSAVEMALNPVTSDLEFGANDHVLGSYRSNFQLVRWARGWSTPAVGEPLVVDDARSFDVTFDAAGTEHVVHSVFSEPETYTMQHIVRVPGGLTTTAIGEGQIEEIAFGPDGTMHILFLEPDYGFGHGWLAPGGSWQFETIAPSPHGWAPSIAFDSQGGIHVAEVRFSPNWDLVYWYRPAGGTWTSAVVDDTSMLWTGRTRIAVDAHGSVLIAYASMERGQVRWAERSACP